MSDKTRRRFFKELAASSASIGLASPLAVFVDSILSKAMADVDPTTVKPRRLISFQQAQAPARWAFDLFLTPYLSDSELAMFDPGNPMIRTRFAEVGGRNSQLVYETTKQHGINAPAMWAIDVPTSAGGTRPMADLLLNMLSLQGINTTNAGHTISRHLHFLPPGTSQSVSALASDYGQFPLGTLGTAANFGFRSKFGKSPLTPGSLSGNYLTQILQPFILTLASSRLDPGKAPANSTFQRMSRIVDDYAKTIDNKQMATVFNKSSAHELMLKGFGNLTTIWNDRLAVYNKLVKDALAQTSTMAGFTDFPIGLADVNARDVTYSFSGPTNLVKYDDLNELFTGPSMTAAIAGNFVVAEYLILNDLSNSVCQSIGSLGGIKVTSGKNTIASFNMDQHFDGSMIALLLNFWMHRAISACMLELIDRLKEKTVAGTTKSYFEETVIELHGDFHRNPRADGSGADHGFQGKSVMYLSGAIDGPYVVGALGRAPANDSSPGAWGLGAVDPVLNKQVTNADMAATTANLLRVPNPFTTTSPMALLKDDGTVVPVAIKTRIV